MPFVASVLTTEPIETVVGDRLRIVSTRGGGQLFNRIVPSPALANELEGFLRDVISRVRSSPTVSDRRNLCRQDDLKEPTAGIFRRRPRSTCEKPDPD